MVGQLLPWQQLSHNIERMIQIQGVLHTAWPEKPSKVQAHNMDTMNVQGVNPWIQRLCHVHLEIA